MKAWLYVTCACLLAFLPGCVVVDLDEPGIEAADALRPSPGFPGTDASRGNEGWVLVAYEVSSSGRVIDPQIAASSGRSSFERATLKAIRNWRHLPGEQGPTSVLVVFEFKDKAVRVSGEFGDWYRDTHTLIDAGDLSAADALLEKKREKTESPYEVAFIYLARARIAGQRGNLDEQLQYYRQAMLHEGRWLAPENYHACLRASVMLAIMLEDYATAVRDYELLTRSGATSDAYADLEDSINAARAVLEQDQVASAPFTIADATVAVTRERESFHAGEMPRGPPTGRGATPPMSRPQGSNNR